MWPRTIKKIKQDLFLYKNKHFEPETYRKTLQSLKSILNCWKGGCYEAHKVNVPQENKITQSSKTLGSC